MIFYQMYPTKFGWFDALSLACLVDFRRFSTRKWGHSLRCLIGNMQVPGLGSRGACILTHLPLSQRKKKQNTSFKPSRGSFFLHVFFEGPFQHLRFRFQHRFVLFLEMPLFFFEGDVRVVFFSSFAFFLAPPLNIFPKKRMWKIHRESRNDDHPWLNPLMCGWFLLVERLFLCFLFRFLWICGDKSLSVQWISKTLRMQLLMSLGCYCIIEIRCVLEPLEAVLQVGWYKLVKWKLFQYITCSGYMCSLHHFADLNI